MAKTKAAQKAEDLGLDLRRCTTCGKLVFFVDDNKGTRQILDAVAPVFTIGGTGCFRAPASFVSHFSTCPDASQHSKKK